ncbi:MULTISPECIES: CdaR family transcriptional regulator [Nocardia]|uniref:PucR family transcriptional regulator n=1 Tax=Nocardia TaxID=1817 RepID=UPI0007EBDD5A|nr:MULTISPECIES: helix-turn-helix domain-containing protein [Nocardia]MBF6272173.1 helix-turn-helix domain-containing protein [Nocardia nova]OBA46224.1 PucR family transcriptional regulator [Nocardia sp. 852002-51101_SCH5132738]OBB44782.1 PucR family transcriptional regulator [Nocardia sp. 852002-51244_SCH5132740]
MTKAHDGEVGSGEYVARIAARMNEQVTGVSSLIKDALEQLIPELRGDARTVELLGASVEGNVDTILHALRHGIAVERITAPTAALEYARRLAQHGVPVNALVRAYRLGQRRLTELVFAELHAIDMEPTTRIAVIEEITDVLFAYIDWISQQVVAVYEEERERWLENRNSVRAMRVREMLAQDTAVDVDDATAAIRYPLRRHHVAMVLWYPDADSDSDDLARLQRFVRELAGAVDAAAAPLFAAADRTSGWVWLPFTSDPGDPAEQIRRFALGRPDTPHIAIGAVGVGVDGFRRSHRQAQQARAVAARRGPEDKIVASTDPGLMAVALLGGNPAAVRDWVADVLGPLATDTASDARLRDTLRVFLRTGSSYKAAAQELDLHYNSVKYRVGRAVSRRGRPIADARLDVELALLVCHWYGKTVLTR